MYGIGDILAQTIMLETGNIHRFSTVGDFASYGRCVDSQKTSNGKGQGYYLITDCLDPEG